MKRYCFWWSTTDHIAWPRADWTWAECELVSEICATWGKEGVWWKNENIIWSKCTGSIPTDCAVWGTTNVWWKNVNWWWSQCSGSIPVPPPGPGITASLHPPGVDAMTLQQPWLIEPWSPYRQNDSASLARQSKKKRLIKLICKVKGQTYEQEKEVGDMEEISVDDIRMVVKAVSNIDLDVKMEE